MLRYDPADVRRVWHAVARRKRTQARARICAPPASSLPASATRARSSSCSEESAASPPPVFYGPALPPPPALSSAIAATAVPVKKKRRVTVTTIAGLESTVGPLSSPPLEKKEKKRRVAVTTIVGLEATAGPPQPPLGANQLALGVRANVSAVKAAESSGSTPKGGGLACAVCCATLPDGAFSKRQKKKGAQRRCPACIAERPAPAPGAAPLPLPLPRAAAPVERAAYGPALPPPPALSSSTAIAATAAPAGTCDKCDGAHATDSCPHFRKARNVKASGALGSAPRSIYDAGSTDAHFVLRNARIARQPGDGSCLFHSLAFFAAQMGSARKVRNSIARFIRTHPKLSIADSPLRDWIKWESGSGVKRYADKMAMGGVWGGGIEMAVFSRLAKINVHVYERESSPRRRSGSGSGSGLDWLRGGGKFGKGGGKGNRQRSRYGGGSGGGGGGWRKQQPSHKTFGNGGRNGGKRKRKRSNSGDFASSSSYGGRRVGAGSFGGGGRGGGGGGAYRRIGCFDVAGARKTAHILYSGRVHYDALVLSK